MAAFAALLRDLNKENLPQALAAIDAAGSQIDASAPASVGWEFVRYVRSGSPRRSGTAPRLTVLRGPSGRI